MLKKDDIIYVIGADGRNEMSFGDFCSAVRGGLNIEKEEITTDYDESFELFKRRKTIERIVELLADYDYYAVNRLEYWLCSAEGSYYLNKKPN